MATKYTTDEVEDQVRACHRMRNQGDSHRAIGQALGISRMTVRRRLEATPQNVIQLDVDIRDSRVVQLKIAIEHGLSLAQGASDAKVFRDAMSGVVAGMETLSRLEDTSGDDEVGPRVIVNGLQLLI